MHRNPDLASRTAVASSTAIASRTAVAGSTAMAALLLATSATAQLPCFDSAPGTDLGLGDEMVAVSQPLGFVFPGPAGPVSSVSVSSNGFVWLGTNPATGCCHGDGAAFLAQGARIAIAWTDLAPGSVQMRTVAAAGGVPARAVITWRGVVENGQNVPFTAQLQLGSDGSIAMSWSDSVRVQQHAMLVGITGGGVVGSSAMDLSATLAGAVLDSGSAPVCLETFAPDRFDLAGRTLAFVPNGQGGYRITEEIRCRTASFVSLTRGCPSLPSVYERFAPGTLDLTNRALRFVPNGAGGYVVTSAPGTPDLSVLHNVVLTSGDQVARAQPLGFAFPHGGTQVTQIDISSNGCIYLAANTIADARGGEPSLSRFFAESPSIAALWTDLEPAGAGAVFCDAAAGSGRCFVTWYQLREAGSTLPPSVVQLVLEASGAWELRYSAVQSAALTVIVGYSAGNSAQDPGSVDLGTAVGLDTGPAGQPIVLAPASGQRPALGTTCLLDVRGIPAGSWFGALVIGTGRLQPTLDLANVGMPGCPLHVALAGSASRSFFPVGAQATIPLQIPLQPALIGVTVIAQAAVDAAGLNAAGLGVSNGGALSLGW